MSKTASKRQQLRALIEQAVLQGGQRWPPRSSERYLYSIGLLTELLSYSAQDQIEVWQHLERLAQRDKK